MTSFATESHNNSAMMMDEDELKELDSGDDFMYISVTDPNKMGEGMSSFMAYKVVTRTNSNYFKKKEMVVTRRFSDFLGLHDKLAEKYRQNGRIIPPAPDKSVVGMTKVKMTKDGDEIQDEVKKNSGEIKVVKQSETILFWRIFSDQFLLVIFSWN